MALEARRRAVRSLGTSPSISTDGSDPIDSSYETGATDEPLRVGAGPARSAPVGGL
jgi:hypothetical protein